MGKRRHAGVEKRQETREWSSGRLWTVGLILLLCGFLNNSTAPQPITNYGESFRVAMNLYHEGSFANPYMSLPTGPTALPAPGYPFLQSLVLRLFGDGFEGWQAIGMLATAAQSAQYALLPWLAARLGFSAWTGVIAALLGLWVKAPREELWECQLAGLLMMLLTSQMLRGDWRTGVMAGITFLVQPVMAATFFLWAAVSKRWLLIAIPVAICAPWIARNYFEVGGLSWIRSSFGLEMQVSFNDCTPYGTRQSELRVCYPTLHPNVSEVEAHKVLALGEHRYDRDKLRSAFTWIVEHPAQTASLMGQRAWYFWFPSDYGWAGYAAQTARFATLHILTVLSFAGLWLSWKRRIADAWVLSLWMGAFPLVYYLALFDARYRTPILWISYLLAAFTIQVMVEIARGGLSRVTIKVPRNATV